jgi:hypothetical protein
MTWIGTVPASARGLEGRNCRAGGVFGGAKNGEFPSTLWAAPCTLRPAMPRTAEDVENFLMQLSRHFEIDGGTYLVSAGAGQPLVAIRIAPPIVAVRVAIGSIPPDPEHQAKLFRRLLEYNTTDLMHASYGIDDHTIVLSSALPLDNLDLNELEATLSDVDLALARHVPTLHDLATGPSADAAK